MTPLCQMHRRRRRASLEGPHPREATAAPTASSSSSSSARHAHGSNHPPRPSLPAVTAAPPSSSDSTWRRRADPPILSPRSSPRRRTPQAGYHAPTPPPRDPRDPRCETPPQIRRGGAVNLAAFNTGHAMCQPPCTRRLPSGSLPLPLPHLSISRAIADAVEKWWRRWERKR